MATPTDRLAKNPCKPSHTVDIPQARIPKVLWRRSHPVLQCKLQQSHESWYQSLTTPIVYCPYCPQMTTTHHTESLVALFFGRYLHLSRHPCEFLVDIAITTIVQRPELLWQCQRGKCVRAAVAQSTYGPVGQSPYEY